MEVQTVVPEQNHQAQTLSRDFRNLVLLVIPIAVSDVLTGNAVAPEHPALQTAGLVLALLTQLCYGGILLQMRRAEERYRTAGLCLIGSAAATFVTEVIGVHHPNVWLLFPALLGAVLDLCGIYFEYHAHMAVLAPYSEAYSRKWHHLWYWFIGIYAAMMLSVVLMRSAPAFGAGLFFGCSLAGAIVIIMKFVYLQRTSRLLHQI